MAQTAIVTDGSLGQITSLSGPDVQIGADLGERSGGNLFHSFERFDIGLGGRATFTGPGDINNVISRVTGGLASSIDGTLASTIGSADVWLINPAGVMMGSGARLDVPAGFHVSTADDIGFADGAVFSATDPASSTLSVTPPESFGFLGGSPGGLSVLGGSIEVPSGRPFALIGGDVLISGGIVRSAGGSLDIRATDGVARIVPFEAPPMDAVPTGAVRVSSNALVDTAGAGGGELRLGGASVILEEGATVRASNFGGATPGAGVAIDAGAFVAMDGARILVDAFGAGDGAPVFIRADDVRFLRGGQVRTSTRAGGNAGDVSVDARSVTVDDEALGAVFTNITSFAEVGSRGDSGSLSLVADEVLLARNGQVSTNTSGQGNAAPIFLRTERLVVDGGGSGGRTGIGSNAQSGSVGDGGFIEVRANEVQLLQGAQISTSTFGPGRAGDVDVVAGSIEIDDFGRGNTATEISSAVQSSGLGGSIRVVADTLDLRRNGQIATVTSGEGPAGDIVVDAEKIMADGGLVNGLLTGVGSSVSAGATGTGGGVTINAGEIDLSGGGLIRTQTRGEGDAGSIQINADAFLIDANGRFDISTGVTSLVRPEGRGDAGTVDITGGELRILRNGQIVSSTLGGGDAPGVRLDVAKLFIDGQALNNVLTGVSSTSRPGSTGIAGNVVVAADDIELIAGGQIRSSTFTAAAAGEVQITTGALTIDDQIANGVFTGVSSSSQGGNTGDGGRVSIKADDVTLLRNGQIISSTFSDGDAGEVVVDAARIVADGAGSAVLTGISSTALLNTNGDAGRVWVNAGEISLSDGAQIRSVTRGRGDAGVVEVNAGQLNLDGGNRRRITTGISTTASGESSGDAGRVTIDAGVLSIADGASISSSALSSGTAGDVSVRVDQVSVQNASIQTVGVSNAGGRIDVTGQQTIRLSNGTITTNGALPAEGASLLSLRAPLVEILDASRVLSIAGGDIGVESGARTGAALVAGVITIVSDDSIIAASTNVDIQGIDSEIGSGLQLSEANPINISRLLASPCATANLNSNERSSFEQVSRATTIQNSPANMLRSTALDASGKLAGC